MNFIHPLALLLVCSVAATPSFPQGFQNESVLFHSVTDDYYTGFGKSVAISDDWLMVSDWGRRGTEGTGAVDVFRHTEAGWLWHQEILSAEPRHGSQFGSRIALDGDTLVVGAPTWGWFEDRPDDPYFASGKAFVYELQGNNWSHTITLRPTIPDAWRGDFNGAGFGRSVAVNENRIAVSCTGTYAIAETGRGGIVYTYKRVGGLWVVDHPIICPACPLPGLPNCGGSYWSSFGANIELDGDRLVIPAPFGFEGMVSTWLATASGWQSEAFISSPIPAAPPLSEPRHFGDGVSLDGNRMAIGLTSSSCNNPPCPSLVAIYELQGSNWVRVQILDEINAEPGSVHAQFGADIKLKGDTLFASAIGMQHGSRSVAQIRRYDYTPGYGFQLTQKFRHKDLPTISPNSTLGDSFDVNFEQGWLIAGDRNYAYSSATTAYGWAAGTALFFDLELGHQLTCQGSNNTSGHQSHLAITGSLAVNEDRLTLHATHLPPGELALFLYGQPWQTWSIPSGGDLCLGGAIHRLPPPGLVGPLGERFMALDFSTPRESANLLAGTTWGFQVWYRDRIPGWTFTGTTNAIEILLQ